MEIIPNSENGNKKKSPYSGLWVHILLLVGTPLVLFAIIYYLIMKNHLSGKELAIYTSLTFAYGLGFVIQISCAFAGAFKGSLKVIFKRIREFFDDLIISFKYAVKSYFDNIKNDGVLFWIYLYIILGTLAIAIFSAYKYLKLVENIL